MKGASPIAGVVIIRIHLPQAMNVDGCAALRVAPECLFASPAHIECLPSLAGHSSPFGRIIMRFHARFQSPTRFSAHLCQKIARIRSEEHTSELQSLMRISYAVFCLKKKTKKIKTLENYLRIYTNHHKQ